MMNKKGLGTLLLTGALLVSANTSVFAAQVPTVGTGTEDNGATVSVTKNFEFAEGISTPQVTFNFSVTKVTQDAPNATITGIAYTKDEAAGDVKGGKYTISKDSQIAFGTFPHAGMYEYKVTETNDGVEGITYSTTEYILRVYVANKADGSTYIKTITAEDNQTKKDKVLFTNTYVKNGGSETPDSGSKALKIEKQTTGDLADKTKKFTFKLILTKAATTNETTVTGKIGTREVEFTYGQEKEFELSDKEALVFETLPAGTRYVVTEVGVEDGYVPTVNVIENGAKNPEKKGNDKDDLTSVKGGEQSNLVGENENKVVFVNDFSDDNVPITGIIENNMPFILLIGVGASAFGVLAAAKKRKKSEA